MIKVLVVDDSPVVREFLTQLFSSDPEVMVVGTVGSGSEAIEAVRRKMPDVVTMDVQMPRMDGYEATRIIMETNPVPIVIVSGSVDPNEVTTTFRAMEAGALAVVSRPAGMGHPDHEKTVKELIKTVKLMSEVRVVRRWPRPAPAAKLPLFPEKVAGQEAPEVSLVAIGASTGGPIAIQRILASLPRDFFPAVLVVQHMARGFIAGFTEWLAQSSAIPVKIAVQGEPLHSGCVYVAPDGFDMGVGTDGRIALKKGDNNNGHCPSVSHLFRSIASIYGRSAVGVLLTGMGKDGAAELRLMREHGAVTIAQDAESSIVYGMPGEAAKLGAAEYILPLDRIQPLLVRLVKPGRGINGTDRNAG
jgi:two-component system chemotaxis response regulator CheB